MGCLLRGVCSCGFHIETRIGAGRADFRERCAFPCLCKSCRTVVTVNLMEDAPQCPACKSSDLARYDALNMHDGDGRKEIASWRLAANHLKLTDASYYCPSCSRLSMRFRVVLNFD